jgi:glycosyltransferase involved in cell wall biosynthesis
MLAQAGSVHTIRWSRGLAGRGHNVRLFSNSEIMTQPQGIETVFLPGKSALAYLINIPKIKKIIREFKPDVVHAHYATGYAMWGSVQKTAPLIVSVWGTDIDDAINRRITVGRITRRALKSAGFVTATSKYLIDKTLSFEPSIESKTVCIPFGVPIPDINELKQLEESPETVNIIFAKIYLPNYAPDLVIRAFALAYREIPQLRLRMIGGGPLKGQLHELADKLGLTDKVSIEGFVDNQSAMQIIRKADIMVMPSYKEAFGVAALDAASYGIPVIAGDVGGVPEIVEDGVSGILIPPGNPDALKEAIVRLGADGQLREKMGTAARKIAREKYNFEDCLDKMEGLYRKMAGS